MCSESSVYAAKQMTPDELLLRAVGHEFLLRRSIECETWVS